MARRYSAPTADCLALPGLDLDRLDFRPWAVRNGAGLPRLLHRRQLRRARRFGCIFPGVVALVIGRFLLGDEIHPFGYVAMVLTLGPDRTWGGERGPRGNAPVDVNRHDGPVGGAPGSPQPEADMG